MVDDGIPYQNRIVYHVHCVVVVPVVGSRYICCSMPFVQVSERSVANLRFASAVVFSSGCMLLGSRGRANMG